MYDELIKLLRECTAEQNGEKTLWHQAADAIEELQKKSECPCWYGDIQFCSMLGKAIR